MPAAREWIDPGAHCVRNAGEDVNKSASFDEQRPTFPVRMVDVGSGRGNGRGNGPGLSPQAFLDLEECLGAMWTLKPRR
uniref:Uncharacterized protein n=1 Tax=Physcomitrium patens TaxID=3218 RepID=A0A2K1L7H5_PHYPA|nr:hypothetical protein PHYPA_000412 [Physcomitrium patens]